MSDDPHYQGRQINTPSLDRKIARARRQAEEDRKPFVPTLPDSDLFARDNHMPDGTIAPAKKPSATADKAARKAA